MIFVTVGAQMPFDRLIRAVDKWATSRGRADIFAQTGPSDFRPQSIKSKNFIHPQEYREWMRAATAIVAHAGMGTILTALELGRPIIVMPRRGDLRETRNDHQIHTATRLLQHGRIIVAFDEAGLTKQLDLLETSQATERIGTYASNRLIATIRDFIEARV